MLSPPKSPEAFSTCRFLSCPSYLYYQSFCRIQEGFKKYRTESKKRGDKKIMYACVYIYIYREREIKNNYTFKRDFLYVYVF